MPPSATRTFVDTSAFYALADRTDRHHSRAITIFQALVSRSETLTTDHVVVETWLLLRARLGYGAAMSFWDALGSGVVTVVGVGSADFGRARAIAQAWEDQSFSLVDCTSFAVIERLDLRTAFAFDAHFRVFRYGRHRTKSLRLLT
jgi:predicted nucleic acid-binding protein